MPTPFAHLKSLETLALKQSVGLPQREEIAQYWTALAYRIGDETFVSPLEQVIEVLTVPEMIRLPLAQPWVLGVISRRGELTPVYDFMGLLGRGNVAVDGRARLIVARLGAWSLALLVSESLGLRHFQVDARRAFEEPANELKECVVEEVVEPWRSWKILDLQRLLHGEAVLAVSALA
ncbi:MAG: chemotaxis protein CheW [Halothiobacillaceae bacterium]|nr:chemotaxis protein CheW [Halothiobacillaceae bacterium]